MRFKSTLFTISLLLAPAWSAAQPPASVEQLSWMTGTWQVALGANTLEESWGAPAGGSLAAMVRMYGETTSMFEVFTIEEKDGTLTMTVQQWDTGFKPRQPEAQQLVLTEIGDQQVKFEAVTEGPIPAIAWSRSGDSLFLEGLGRRTELKLAE